MHTVDKDANDSVIQLKYREIIYQEGETGKSEREIEREREREREGECKTERSSTAENEVGL